MKKLLVIVVLGLLFSGNAYAEEKTKLICTYMNTFYQNWDQGDFGQTIVSEDAQPSIYFNFSNNPKIHRFETNLSTNWEWIAGGKFEKISTDGEHQFMTIVEDKYMSIILNRYDGLLTFLLGYTNDENKYQWRETFKCKKAVQKF